MEKRSETAGTRPKRLKSLIYNDIYPRTPPQIVHLKLQNGDSTLQAFNSKLQILDSKLQDVDSKLQILDSELQIFDPGLQNINLKLHNIDSRLRMVDSKLQALDSKLQNHAKMASAACDAFGLKRGQPPVRQVLD